jgi:hypothetical protein
MPWYNDLEAEVNIGAKNEIIDPRILHNEELHSLCCSPNMSVLIKSRSMRVTGNITRIVEKRNACRFLGGGSQKERDH